MKTYTLSQVHSFLKSASTWGGFGNMTGGFPFRVFPAPFPVIVSTENLYQAMRFPHHPEWQAEILAAKSGFGCKMVARRDHRRRDHTIGYFEENKVHIMRWCLQLKVKNHVTFRQLLVASAGRDIVELSAKDTFWGAKVHKDDPDLATGDNKMGQLLMEMREAVIAVGGANPFPIVTAPNIEGFTLLGRDFVPF